MQLANKVCLVAGASGAIGTAVARLFHDQGARLCLTSHTQPSEIADIGPDRVLRFELDVRKKEQIDDVAARVVKHFETIDVLVNCTGILGPVGPTSEVSAADWIKTIEINLIGTFYLTQAVLPLMLRRGSGKIIHFSGGGAAYGRPYFTAYGASKAALVRFVESLAAELGDAHIDVNAIAPGPVKSRMWEELRAVASTAGLSAIKDVRKMDQNGGVSPELAANLALFLASERSNGLTGRLISAVHDRWQTFEDRIEQIVNSEAGTLRRVPLL